ncbi:TonB-dependent receptor [Algivirga pacifica]|uniref:TonB-dependent receptor n=1 Tax=Algivirga pacifica TaxID=1162670 RepID=A0ABP9D4G9_9BACT
MKKYLYLLTISLLATLQAVAQNSIQVSGTITTKDQEVLPGVSVVIKGTSKGTTTDFNGQFSLNMEEAATIQVRYVGYTTQEIQVNASQQLNIVLEEEDVFMEDIVVIGSRNANRTSVETAVPVDVVPMDQVTNSVGQVDVNQLLQFAVPSFNSNKNSGTDASDHVESASLRGLGPDQVLVLINGKRRHTSSLLSLYGTRERGKVGTDLASIPTAAIERIEVLRDGASAQYGSDAIAGVINIVLKEQTDQVLVNVASGIHQEGDGENVTVNTNFGAKIGDEGFVNVTAELSQRGATNRAPDYEEMRIIGQSERLNAALFVNSEIPVINNTVFYAFGGVNYRIGGSDAWGRSADDDRNIPEIYPNGFVPRIESDILDFSTAVGLKGEWKGWDWDLSNTFGYNRMAFDVTNTLNTSLGAASPTAFYAGGFSFGQNTVNAGISKFYDKALEGMNVAAGLEYRMDQYTIFAGDEGSWKTYDTNFAGGAQGYPGFAPHNEVNATRNSFAAYADVELDITKKWMIGAAIRGEYFNDFGSTVNGKFSTRYKLSDAVAVRGSISTGFRAPSLQQAYFNTAYTEFVAGEATDVVLTSNDSEVAKALGIPTLKQETSNNYSLGLTVTPIENLSITVDGYLVDIEDRVVMTGYFFSRDDEGNVEPGYGQILEDMNVSGAAFFTNAIDTRTKGIDLVATYKLDLGAGNLNLTLGGNYNQTKVVGDIKTTELLEGKEDIYFGERERLYLEGSAPRLKGNFGLNYMVGKWSFMNRYNYFGEVIMGTWTGDGLYQNYAPKTTTDLTVGYQISEAIKLSVGGSNIFNVYPDKQDPNETDSGGYWEGVQMGYNGAYYFGRLSIVL